MRSAGTADPYSFSGVPGGVRFRPRDRPPEPLFDPPNVNYPSDDGRARWETSLQGDWMIKIKGGLSVLFRDNPNVFVAANLMWYPVEGNNRMRLAPDVMVVFGRPKGQRHSYVQHEEGRVPPQVVFEILSSGNRQRVMDFKRKVYEQHGVNEYYVIDPFKISLQAWLRDGEAFRLIPEASEWVSPLLGIQFELAEDLTIYDPNGKPFLDYVEIARQRDDFDRKAEESKKQVETLRRIERMAAKLRELGIDPDE